MTKKEFWITNISNKNIILADLNLTINAYKSVNLLSKHYHFTLEEIERSVKSGSLFKRKDKIKIRETAPKEEHIFIKEDKNTIIPERTKSIYFVKEEHYEELDISDEKFAEENADFNE